MKSHGFTVVELLVVMIIMAILLTLAIITVRSTQSNARDTERRTDTDNISIVLESFYNTSHTNMYPSEHPNTTVTKAYPGTYDLWPSSPQPEYTKNYITTRISNGSLHAPGVDVDSLWSFVAATNNSETTSGVEPQPTTSQYVYQPITQSGALCRGVFYVERCVRFSIYYALENASAECPGGICVIRSKHQ